MNQFIIVGRVAEKPIIKESVNGNRYCQLPVAVKRSYKNASGHFDKDVIAVTLWKGLTEENFEKGDLVGVKGHIQSNNYERDDGMTVYRSDYIAEKLTFVGVE